MSDIQRPRRALATLPPARVRLFGTERARKRHNSAAGRANAVHTSPQDMCELGRTRDAGSELAGTHTRVGHTPATRTRRHHARCRGRLAPTSPPSADCALCRRPRRIPSVMAADEALAKGERPLLKGRVSDSQV